MKKIGRITINPEKVIKKDELVNLKGGYGGGEHIVFCKLGDYGTICQLDVYSCSDTQWLFEICRQVCHPAVDSLSCV